MLRTDPDSKAKLLLTESGAEEFDRAKKVRSARNEVLRHLPLVGLDEIDYLREEQRLSENFGTSASPGDIYWGLANQTLQRLMSDPKNNDLEHWATNAHQIQQIYWRMGLHLLREGRSREQIQKEQRESHRWRLTKEQSILSATFQGLDNWRAVVLTDTCCETCRVLEGKEYTYEEALDELPLPQPDCEEDWCTCWWSNRSIDTPFDSDLEGEVSIEYEDTSSSSSGASQGCLTSTAVFIGVLLLAIAGVLAAVGV